MGPRVLALACLASWAGCRSAERREFDGAYPRDARPNGVVRDIALKAAPARVPLVDGHLVDVWAYNGQVPGPTLRVQLGDTLRVHFTNALPQATTVHWHGVRVPNPMDGVPGVTQPAIAPGDSFVYEFTPKDAGTFWFHPHLRSSEQVERGLFGVLVVEDGQTYARDEVWVLDDWLLGADGQIVGEFNTRHDLIHDGRWGNVVTVNGDRRARTAVRPGERLRVRLVNVANGRVFRPDFGELVVRGIAVDGRTAARPFDVTAAGGFELAPGNRLDLDVTVPPALGGRSVVVSDRFTRETIALMEVAVAGDAVATPVAATVAAHIPAWRGAAALPPRTEIHLDSRAGGEYGIQWTLNGQAMDHAHHGADPLATLPLDEFSKLRFINDSFRLHPMHIHGMFFKLLARNGQPVDEPHWRDTVLVHPKETVEIGVVPEDRGRWMIHCHILEHAESGMMALLGGAMTTAVEAFAALHTNGCFILPNPWDRGSAMYLQSLGFHALATTSGGVANARGLPDGAVARDAMLAHIREIVTATDLPVNADFESAFAREPADVAANVTLCVGTGVAGLSVEDSTGDRAQPLFELPLAVERVRAARAAIDATGTRVLLTARAECFLVGMADALAESIRRLEAYADAGADCLYAPGLRTREEIAAVVRAVAPRPVNVLVAGVTQMTLAELAELGVRRLSTGSALARAAWSGFLTAAREMATEGKFTKLDEAEPSRTLNAFFRERAR